MCDELKKVGENCKECSGKAEKAELEFKEGPWSPQTIKEGVVLLAENDGWIPPKSHQPPAH